MQRFKKDSKIMRKDLDRYIQERKKLMQLHMGKFVNKLLNFGFFDFSASIQKEFDMSLDYHPHQSHLNPIRLLKPSIPSKNPQKAKIPKNPKKSQKMTKNPLKRAP